MLAPTKASISKTREETIITWYEEVFPLAAAHIHRNGGDLDAAKEIFQEAVVLYYEKLMHLNFQPESGDTAYLMGIVKNKWLKYCKKFSTQESLDYIEVAEESIQKPVKAKLLHYLKQAGEKCMDLLQSFYYEKLTMRQVADRFEYASERSATVQKFKCLEKVRYEVKRKSLSHEDFLN
ncbi:MAG: sigma-70 family RNA polymerase sigma factor [Bacteroidota bacterium]